jgi:membrane fusion protein (multidrug efflux system)
MTEPTARTHLEGYGAHAEKKAEHGAAGPKDARRPWIILAGVIALVLVGVGIWYFAYGRNHETTDDAFIEAHVIPVSSNVPGHVLHVYVDDNQQVERGRLLVEIDPADFRVRWDQSRAEVAAAQAESARAKADAERYQTLFAQDQVSKQVLDRAVSEAGVAAAKVELDRKRVAAAELELSYTKIMAPEAGRVTHKAVEPGAYIQVGQPLLALVPSEVWVIANFKETQLTHMRPGQPATIEVDAYSGRRFKGHVDSIQAGTGARFSLLPPENATGNYVKVVQRVPVKIVFDEPAGSLPLLTPGMSVVPDVETR